MLEAKKDERSGRVSEMRYIEQPLGPHELLCFVSKSSSVQRELTFNRINPNIKQEASEASQLSFQKTYCFSISSQCVFTYVSSRFIHRGLILTNKASTGQNVAGRVVHRTNLAGKLSHRLAPTTHMSIITSLQVHNLLSRFLS